MSGESGGAQRTGGRQGESYEMTMCQAISGQTQLQLSSHFTAITIHLLRKSYTDYDRQQTQIYQNYTSEPRSRTTNNYVNIAASP